MRTGTGLYFGPHRSKSRKPVTLPTFGLVTDPLVLRRLEPDEIHAFLTPGLEQAIGFLRSRLIADSFEKSEETLVVLALEQFGLVDPGAQMVVDRDARVVEVERA